LVGRAGSGQPFTADHHQQPEGEQGQVGQQQQQQPGCGGASALAWAITGTF
jgi:hypothetical protein